jgi:hypothetical protein
MFWLSPLLFAGVMTPVMLPADEPLRADRLAAHTGLMSLVQTLDAGSGQQLVIGHAGGEAGTARAEALRAVLVALGLGSARITLAPQPLDEPVLIISLEKTAR